MPITGQGFEIHVERLGLHHDTVPGRPTMGTYRTYGKYAIYRNGTPIPALAGYMCEATGPGDNSRPNNGLRIAAGRYPLTTQFGQLYRTWGCRDDDAHPMPGIALVGTYPRYAILIHPGHLPRLFLSSVGCLNPTRALAPTELMDFAESRARVLALIEVLRAHTPEAFVNEVNTLIPDAHCVIDGEPMTVLNEPPPAHVPTPVAGYQPPDLHGSGSS